MSTPEYDELEAEFGEVMSILRGGVPEMPTEKPAGAVWDAIAAELGTEVAPIAPAQEGHHGLPSVTSTGGGGPVAEVRSITSARSWSRPLAMVAGAAAVLLVGVPLYLGLSGTSGPDAEVELAAMDGWIGTGSAELEGRSLNVRVDGNAAPEGTFYELWLLDVDEGEQVEDLFWVGRVDVAADGSFEVPGDVDLSEFNVVDVSIEPDDGDPEHSGNSILRGGLTDA